MKSLLAFIALACTGTCLQAQTQQPTHIPNVACSDHLFTAARTMAQDHDDILQCTKEGNADATPVCIAKKRSIERVVFFDDHCDPAQGPFAISLNGTAYPLQRTKTNEPRTVAFENTSEKLRVQMTMKGPAEREYVTGKRGKLTVQEKSQPVHVHINKDGSESFFEAKIVELHK